MDHSGLSGPISLIKQGHPRALSAMKYWIWSTSGSWKLASLECESRVDSGLLYVMSTSKATKVQLHILWKMVKIHQSIFIFIIYYNTNWFYIYPLKKSFRWVCFALLEKTRNYSIVKNLIQSSNSNQNSAVLFSIIYGMLSTVQGKKSKVSSQNFNSEWLQTACCYSIIT